MRALTTLLAATLLSGCATTGTTPHDPYEGFNRKMWSFDETLDKKLMKPVAKGYISVVPAFLRHGLDHMLNNVEEPFNAGNSFLQGKPKRGLSAIGRFLINTTVGIGGFTDQATKMGLKPVPEDLGQTLAVWGAKNSTYLVLPFLGPSTVRDTIGSVASQFADPYRVVLHDHLSTWPNFAITAFEFVDARANLIETGADSLLDSSADTYAVTRSAYLQRRAALIADQDSGAGPGGDDAALDAALNELGPTDNGTAPADNSTAPASGQATPPAAPILSPDQANTTPKP